MTAWSDSRLCRIGFLLSMDCCRSLAALVISCAFYNSKVDVLKVTNFDER